MKSQLQANKIRIEVLERENTQLEALLAKVKAAAEQGVLKVSWVPQGRVLGTPKPPRGPQTSFGDPERAKPKLLMLLGGCSGLTAVV